MNLISGLVDDGSDSDFSSTFVFVFFGIIIVTLLSLYLYDAHEFKKCEDKEYHDFCPNYTCPDGKKPDGCHHPEDFNDTKST